MLAHHPVAEIDVGGVLALFLFFGLYLGACWATAKYAERKGQNFAVFFLLGVLISPIVAWIAAMIIRDPRRE
jgi:hypothetical protein